MWNAGAIAVGSKIFWEKHFIFIFINLKTVTLNDSFPCYTCPEGHLCLGIFLVGFCAIEKSKLLAMCSLVSWSGADSSQVFEKMPKTMVPEKHHEGAHRPAGFSNKWEWLSEERCAGAQPGSMAGLSHHALTDFRSSKNIRGLKRSKY